MELALEPDMYSPSIDEAGKYVDEHTTTFPLRCPCGSRKDQIYKTRGSFTTHCKTKFHTKWIERLNNNRTNHLTESIKLSETVKQQHILIFERDKEIRRQTLVIQHLTDELLRLKDLSTSPPPEDLLDFGLC
jgi:hypothetical protein